MSSPLKPLIKGKTPTLLDAKKGNELISVLNALILAKVSPDGFGKVVVGKDQVVIDLAALAEQLVAIHQALQSIADALQNPNFSIVCNGDGSITASLTFPTVSV